MMAESLLSHHAEPDLTEVTVTGAPDSLPEQDARRSRLARLRRRTGASPLPVSAAPVHAGPSFDIAQNDPILGYCQSADGPVDITDLVLDSPGLAAMRAAGVVLVVPLVSSGELIDRKSTRLNSSH